MSATGPESAGTAVRAGSGLRLAVSLLSIVPAYRGGRLPVLDRRSAGQAMAWAPWVGLALGASGAAVAWGGERLSLPPVVAAALAVGWLALLTRGLHLDGLADTADGLGSARPPTEALAVMRRGDVGPFGVVALVLVLLLQVSAAAVAGPWAIAAAATAGRAAITTACRAGVPAARPDGLGALVAGTVARRWVAGAVLVALAAGAPLGVPGVVGVGLGLGCSVLLVRRAVARFGGVTGDVLGAACEMAVTVALVVAATR